MENQSSGCPVLVMCCGFYISGGDTVVFMTFVSEIENVIISFRRSLVE